MGVSPWVWASDTTTGQPSVPPATPVNLTLEVLSSSSIRLTWQAGDTSELGFRVEISTDGVSFSLRASTGQAVVTYTDTGLSPDTLYYYRVKAYNADGDSGYSNIASATTDSNPVTFPPVFDDAEAFWHPSTYSGSGNWLDINTTTSHDLTVGGDMQFLPLPSDSYVWTPGSITNYVDAPITAVTNSTVEEVTIYLRCAFPDATPTVDNSWLRFANTSVTSEQIKIVHRTGGGIRFEIQDGAGLQTSGDSSTLSSESLTADSVYWFKFEITDIQTTSVKGNFFHAVDSTDIPTSWNQIGTQVTATTDGTLGSNLDLLVVGHAEGSTSDPMSFYDAVFQVNGVTVGQYRSSDISPNTAVLDVPTSSGATIPDEAALDFTSDHTIIVSFSTADWTPASAQVLVRKGDTANYGISLSTTGQVQYRVASTDYSTTATLTNLLTDTQVWVRTVYDVSAGTVDVSVSLDGSNWSFLEQLTSLPTSLTANTNVLSIAAAQNGTSNSLDGYVYSVEILNATATKVLDVDFTQLSPGDTTPTAQSGQSITLTGTASIYPGDQYGIDGSSWGHLDNTTSNTGVFLSDNNVALGSSVQQSLSVVALLSSVNYIKGGAGIDSMAFGQWEGATAATRAWGLGIADTNAIKFWSSDGSSTYEDTSTTVTFTDGEPIWIRADYNGTNVSYYYNTAETHILDPTAITWTAAGTDARTHNLNTTTAMQFCVGHSEDNAGSSNDDWFDGKVLYARVGSLLASPLHTFNFTTVPADTEPSSTGGEKGSATGSSAVAGSNVRWSVNRATTLTHTVLVDRPLWISDGSNDYLEASHSTALNADNDFTAVAAFRSVTAPTSTDTVLGKRTDSSSTAQGWDITATSTPELRAEISDGVGEDTDVVTLTLGALTVGVFRLDTVNDELEVFSNAAGSGTPTTSTKTETNTVALRFALTSSNFQDAIIEIYGGAIWNRALTQAEITELTNFFGAVSLDPDDPGPDLQGTYYDLYEDVY